ncbi:MAG: class I SAM-dependent methyltransferase [Bryobacteraceae bacterium]|nr:class I SAM-dependent methyltransferase [Bryobacteraceae bacterium]
MTHPTPARLMQALSAHQLTAAMKTAIDLGLFTAIGEGHNTVDALSQHCHASAKGLRVLCDYLTIQQFLTKENGRYGLTPDSAVFLDRKSPAYFGGVAALFVGPAMKQAFQDLTPVVRKGGTILNDEGGTMSRENPVWEDFARSMVAMMMPPAEAIAQIVKAREGAPMKVLDLAAGHGLFGITIARHNPNAQVYAVDWPSVLDIAREHAMSAGVAERWHGIEGSAFEVEFGVDYDVALITNFHHHFTPAVIEGLMRKVHGALKPDGMAVTLEFVPNDDRVTPPDAASFAMIMLATTAEGDAYTYAEYEAMYRNCGFSHNELHRLEGPEAVIVSRR